MAVAAPSLSYAQGPWQAAAAPGYNEGFQRGVVAGRDDVRRGQSYDYTDETDYRRGDVGYRAQYGSRDRYRDDFRRGFETGYRSGYGNVISRNPNAPYYDGRDPYGGRGPYNDGRAPYGGRAPYIPNDRRNDLAFTRGFNDGYEKGLDDGHDRRRFDPVDEGWYRSGDRGYERWYGPKELYKARYRDAFRSGYEQGYEDGRRYGNRRPWWWPFDN
jgi:hypothetical protein